jgi:acyl-CoA thioesterase I
VRTRFAVEIAGWLVGKNDLWPRTERTRDGHALLLAAGKLSRKMIGAVRQADLAQHVARALKGLGVAGKFQRQSDVFERRHGGNEVERLEDDANVGATHGGKPVFIEAGEVVLGHTHGARAGAFEAGHDHQQRGLARAAGTDNGHRLASADVERDVLQDRDRTSAAGQRKAHVTQTNHGFSHNAASSIAKDLVSSLANFYVNAEAQAGNQAMSTVPSNARLVNMVLRFLLCNWLIALLALQAQAASPRPTRIVVLGDSLVAGFQLKASDAFPAQLERALRARGHSVEIINAGVSGDTTAGGLERLKWAVPADTDAVILELGANDALRGLDPAQAKSNLDQIIVELKAGGAEVLLAGMLAPRNLGGGYSAAFDAIYPELANTHAVLLYPFFLDGIAMKAQFNLADGIHPNSSGVAEIARRMLPAVEQLIERVRSKQAAASKG